MANLKIGLQNSAQTTTKKFSVKKFTGLAATRPVASLSDLHRQSPENTPLTTYIAHDSVNQSNLSQNGYGLNVLTSL